MLSFEDELEEYINKSTLHINEKDLEAIQIIMMRRALQEMVNY